METFLSKSFFMSKRDTSKIFFQNSAEGIIKNCNIATALKKRNYK